MGKFEELFDLIEEGVEYTFPNDPEVSMMDFYVLSYLSTIDIENTATQNSGAVRINDAQHDIQHAKDVLTKELQTRMLDDVFFSLCAEVRHMKGESSIKHLNETLPPDVEKFYYDFKDYGMVMYDDIATKRQKETMNSEDEFGYRFSYIKIKDFMKKNSISRRDMVYTFHSIFKDYKWSPQYGGDSWAAIASGWLRLDSAKSESKRFIAIDHLYDLQHNNGSVFDKLRKYYKDGDSAWGYGWILRALDLKANVLTIAELLPKASSKMRRLAQPILRYTNDKIETKKLVQTPKGCSLQVAHSLEVGGKTVYRMYATQDLDNHIKKGQIGGVVEDISVIPVGVSFWLDEKSYISAGCKFSKNEIKLKNVRITGNSDIQLENGLKSLTIRDSKIHNSKITSVVREISITKSDIKDSEITSVSSVFTFNSKIYNSQIKPPTNTSFTGVNIRNSYMEGDFGVSTHVVNKRIDKVYMDTIRSEHKTSRANPYLTFEEIQAAPDNTLKESVGVINESVDYTMPNDPEVLMMDFYILSNLSTIDIDNASKISSNAIRINDSLDDIQHAKDVLLPTLKKQMLGDVFFSLCAEFRHLFHRSEVQRYIRDESLIEFIKTYKTQRKTPNRLNTKRELNKTIGENSEYAKSYLDIKRTMAELSLSKRDVVYYMHEVFSHKTWDSSYGGESWAAIASGWLRLDSAKSEQKTFVAIDHMYDLQHNNGSVFTKVARYQKQKRYGGHLYAWIVKSLDFKASALKISELVKSASHKMRKLAQPVMRFMDDSIEDNSFNMIQTPNPRIGIAHSMEMGGKTLYRIVALDDIGNIIHKGDIGGIVESPDVIPDINQFWLDGKSYLADDVRFNIDAGAKITITNSKMMEGAVISNSGSVSYVIIENSKITNSYIHFRSDLRVLNSEVMGSEIVCSSSAYMHKTKFKNSKYHTSGDKIRGYFNRIEITDSDVINKSSSISSTVRKIKGKKIVNDNPINELTVYMVDQSPDNTFSENFKGIMNRLVLSEKKRSTGKRKRSATPKSIKTKSKTNRQDRAKNVEVTNLKSKANGKFKTDHTFKASSKEKSESKKHECSITTFNKSKKVDEVACSCSDFQARYRYHRDSEGLNDWNDKVKPKKDIFAPHTRDEPKIMNPKDTGYMCKHLIAGMDVITKKSKK